MVFVDDLIQWGAPGQYRGKDAAQAERVGARHGHYWCHLFADTLAELHAFAKRLGLKREWFQIGHFGFGHYDLAGATMRARAVSLGAVELPLDVAVRIIEGCDGIEKVKRGPSTSKEAPWLE